MLSFGMEYERAFSIAFCNARLPPGSGPPSFAATMIARDSFEKSLPRFASAAPFLCLIEDHLLCPDTGRLPHLVEEQFVHPRIFGQLGVKRRNQEAPLAQEDGLAVVLRQHFHLVPQVADARRADEDAAQRLVVVAESQVGLEARDLAAVRVSIDVQIHQVEVPAIEHDHAGTGAEYRPGEGAQGLVEAVEPHQPHEGRGLAARDDEAVEPVQLLRLADLDDVCAETSQHGRMLTEISLDSEDSDAHLTQV